MLTQAGVSVGALIASEAAFLSETPFAPWQLVALYALAIGFSLLAVTKIFGKTGEDKNRAHC